MGEVDSTSVGCGSTCVVIIGGVIGLIIFVSSTLLGITICFSF